MSTSNQSRSACWMSKLASLISGFTNISARRGVLVAGLGGLVLVGTITASALGNMGVITDLDEAVIDALKFGDRKDILLIVAVDQEGNLQAFCGLYNWKPCKPADYEDIPDPIKEVFGYIAVSNPKVCWRTSGGDKECVTYD